MNSVHDMGGMEGFGPLPLEPNEPIFHGAWEKRALAITLATGSLGQWNIDASRHAREASPARTYIRETYYERWLTGLETLLVQRGLLSAEELASGIPNGAPAKVAAVRPEQVPGILARGGPTERPHGKPGRFRIGQRVRALNHHPAGHTRLPRYLRGKIGIIGLDHGLHVFADSNAHFNGEDPQQLYNVVFDVAEVWGPAARYAGEIRADLWDAHLEAA